MWFHLQRKQTHTHEKKRKNNNNERIHSTIDAPIIDRTRYRLLISYCNGRCCCRCCCCRRGTKKARNRFFFFVFVFLSVVSFFFCFSSSPQSEQTKNIFIFFSFRSNGHGAVAFVCSFCFVFLFFFFFIYWPRTPLRCRIENSARNSKKKPKTKKTKQNSVAHRDWLPFGDWMEVLWVRSGFPPRCCRTWLSLFWVYTWFYWVLPSFFFSKWYRL